VTALAAAALCLPARAHAQTTLVLDAPDSEVVDTFIQGGSSANKNFDGSILAVRASTNPDYLRRALVKFDTDRIPKGTAISSAKLTLTVSDGYSTTRLLSAYRGATSWDEHVATWNDRYTSTRWSHAGGDLSSRYAQAYVHGPGTTVTFDVTKLVQQTVNGSFGSRYTRIAIADEGGSTYESYREFYSSESGSSGRPRLTVVYGGSSSSGGSATSTSGSSGSSGSSTTLRVLQWNTHHGGIGTDGKYDPARLAKWIAKINPQVISLNEVDTTDEIDAIVKALKSYTGVSWAYEFSGKGNIALTRLSVVNKDRCVYPDGERYSAHLSVMVNGRPVHIWSTHLTVDSASTRDKEVKQLEHCANQWPEARIMAGDFNMQAGSTEYKDAAAYYTDAWPAAKSLGTTSNYSGNCDGCTRNSRIDYVFSSKGASFLKVKSAQIVDTRDSNGVRPSDHKPMLVVYTLN
jgi:endonuclease/exonuclease/phosphatase family metal-dependent hydrolase